jgi:hypothetical protein
LRDKLAKLGRVGADVRVWDYTELPSFDGYGPTCNFDGITSVVREVTEILEDDLRGLFEGLRAW